MSAIKVNCENIEISNNNKICIIAGPCQLETFINLELLKRDTDIDMKWIFHIKKNLRRKD